MSDKQPITTTEIDVIAEFETAMREIDACEIHFWTEGRSFDGNGDPFNVTVELRGDRGRFYGLTLGEAVAKARAALAAKP